MNTLTVTFRCPPELEPILPRPMPAVLGLPDWFKSMPQKAFSAALQEEQFTVKKCPPFIDAMTYGFLVSLVADVKVENGEFAWDREVPGGAFTNYPRSPIDFHDNVQVAGTPLFDEVMNTAVPGTRGGFRRATSLRNRSSGSAPEFRAWVSSARPFFHVLISV